MKLVLKLGMVGRQLRQNLNQLEIQHSILSIAIILQFFRNQRELSMGLLLIWITINWLIPLKDSLNSKRLVNRGCTYAVALSLILIQVRTIVENQDENGITQFLLIVSGVATTISLDRDRAKCLLQWLSLTTVLGSIVVLLPLLTYYEFTELGVEALNQEVFKEGFGDINQLRIVFAFFTITSIATARISRSSAAKLIAATAACLGYIVIFATESRMSQIAIPLGAFGGWLFSHWSVIRASKRRTAKLLLATLAISLASFVWKIAVGQDLSNGMMSDRGRLALIQCWGTSILSGSNRFLMGFGHDKAPIRKLCTDYNIGYFDGNDTISSSGHAHNTLINIFAHYGILGMIAVGILCILIGRAIAINSRQDRSQLQNKSLLSTSWTECTTSIIISISICAFSNTIYIYNHAIQILLGLLIALPLCEDKPNSHIIT